ncbi:hypothetical protein NQ314_012031 [Rhamnusium bicolor]|uniref:Uncharacterized protein n=1 Tax=Rhamnusium bicolor TaxID=1586634 RepID=A0AAV8XF19_9CUCU|nr:hypothetical protein NQ314_012031 [Rhamnusium bicolor]
MSKVVTRKQLFDLIKQSPARRISEKLKYMENHMLEVNGCVNGPDSLLQEYRHKISHFKSRWAAGRNSEALFVKRNEQWLNNTISLPVMTVVRSGRPPKPFQESSECSKRRKTKELRENVPVSELTFATQMSLRASGSADASKILKDITNSPTRAKKYRKAANQPIPKTRQLTPQEALSMFIEADLTRSQYETIRRFDKDRFPCYSLLQTAKLECYPKKEEITITSNYAEVRLQALMDHTTYRLCLYLSDDIFERFSSEELLNLELISKWGCDGSQQNRYKQKLPDDTDSDAFIFQSSFIPLKLVSNINNEKKTLWANTSPSSPRYCRLMRVRFVHGNVDITGLIVTCHYVLLQHETPHFA